MNIEKQIHDIDYFLNDPNTIDVNTVANMAEHLSGRVSVTNIVYILHDLWERIVESGVAAENNIDVRVLLIRFLFLATTLNDDETNVVKMWDKLEYNEKSLTYYYLYYDEIKKSISDKYNIPVVDIDFILFGFDRIRFLATVNNTRITNNIEVPKELDFPYAHNIFEYMEYFENATDDILSGI